jgi:response regulator NasT
MNIRLIEPQRNRAVLVDAHRDHERFVECLLMDRGIFVVARYGSLSDMASEKALAPAELVIVIDNSLAPPFCEALSRTTARVALPVLVITEVSAPERIEAALVAGAHAILSIGASADRLGAAAVSAIASFERLASLERRAVTAERKLEERKLIERAKGILMQQRGIGEPDAFQELQRTSMQRNQPLPEIARSIIAAKELLG